MFLSLSLVPDYDTTITQRLIHRRLRMELIHMIKHRVTRFFFPSARSDAPNDIAPNTPRGFSPHVPVLVTPVRPNAN